MVNPPTTPASASRRAGRWLNDNVSTLALLVCACSCAVLFLAAAGNAVYGISGGALQRHILITVAMLMLMAADAARFAVQRQRRKMFRSGLMAIAAMALTPLCFALMGWLLR